MNWRRLNRKRERPEGFGHRGGEARDSNSPRAEAPSVLEIRWNENQGEVTWSESSKSEGPLESYEKLSLDLKEIEETAQLLTQRIRAAHVKGGATGSIDAVTAAGKRLFDLLFPARIKSEIRSSRSEYLLLRLDDSCVHIPWELTHDGHDFLCCRFSIGRAARTSQEMETGPREDPKQKLSMLVLADPSEDLPAASREGCDLFRLGKKNAYVTVDLINGRLVRKEVCSQLDGYEIVHYCGHAEYDSQNPDESCWILSKDRFTALDLRESQQDSQTGPLLVFNNACHSGATSSWKSMASEWTFGLANAFLLGGCKFYLGTLSELIDGTGQAFANCFYTYAFDGVPVGRAVRLARLQLRVEAEATNLTWMQYVFYGNPMEPVFSPQAGPHSDSLSLEAAPIGVSFGEGNRTRAPVPEAINATHSWRRWAIGGTLLVVLVGSAFTLGPMRDWTFEAGRNRRSGVGDGETSISGGPRIAVLPFSNLTGDEKLDWLEVGFAETVTSELAQSASLTVIEKSQVDKIIGEIQFQQTEFVDTETAQRIGRFLGAESVLLGSFQSAGGEVSVNLRRVEVRTAEVVAAEILNGKEENVFELQQLCGRRFREILEGSGTGESSPQ